MLVLTVASMAYWAFTTVWGVRDGLINCHQGYTDHAQALRAIGAA